MKLKNKVAVITGGAAGIGYATAEKFLQEGATVVICDLGAEAVQRAVATLGDRGADRARIQGHVADVTCRAQVETLLASVKQQHGGVDILVNNAGITRDAQLMKMTEAQFDSVIDVNLRAVFSFTQAVVPLMLERGGGAIVNASSVVGLYGNFGQSNYAASKFAVIGMTKTWARELGRKGIRVNAVCPGFVATDILGSMPEKVLQGMTDSCWSRRIGQPAEIANVYAFLASDEASFINGAAIEVSGGLSL